MSIIKTNFLLVASFLLWSHSCAFYVDPDHHHHPSDGEPEFSYIEATGRGPSRWGELEPDWKACGIGKLQSPIDLVDRNVQVVPSLGRLQAAYKETFATIKSTGYDITVTWYGDAGEIVVNGTKYKLARSHWHHPSEHLINGGRFDLEFHMVHTNPSRPPAVVAFLYKIGKPDPFLSKLLPFIKTVTRREMFIPMVDPRDIGFFTGNYYRYNGSLTTPPCTEGVVWTVFQKEGTASEEQVKALRDAVDDGYEMNARPIQPLNGRPVYLYSNHSNVDFTA